MNDGWFMLLLMAGLLIFLGALLVFWLLRAAEERRQSAALTAADLQLLEESVHALIAQLNAAADEAAARIAAREERLQSLLGSADAVLAATAPDLASGRDAATEEDLPETTVRRLAEEGAEAGDIARRAGLSRGEVELILGIHAARR